MFLTTIQTFKQFKTLKLNNFVLQVSYTTELFKLFFYCVGKYNEVWLGSKGNGQKPAAIAKMGSNGRPGSMP